MLYEFGKHAEFITALMISIRAHKWENSKYGFLPKIYEGEHSMSFFWTWLIGLLLCKGQSPEILIIETCSF